MTQHPLTHPKGKTGFTALTPWLVVLLGVSLLEWFSADQIDPYFFTIIMYSGINIILAVSLNLVNGFTGQFSMGHAGFMSVGGYTAAYVTTLLAQSMPGFQNDPLLSQVVFVFCLLLGGIVAAGVGYLVGLPSLRLKGDYLAIVTLGFGEIIRVVVLNVDAIGGPRGMPNIPALSSFGWVFTAVVFTVFTVWRVVNSAHGREMLSVREDEIAAEAMGVNTTQAKIKAFALGAFFAGIAGGLFAHYLRYLNPQTFDFNRSFEIIMMVVLGGMGSITGSVVAAVFITVAKEALRPLQELTRLDFRMVLFSLMLIVLMLTRPNGLLGKLEITDVVAKLRTRLTRKKEVQS